MKPWASFIETARRVFGPMVQPSFVGTDQADVVEDTVDSRHRLEVGDRVDASVTPDGVHWTFDDPTLLGRRIEVEKSRVVAVVHVYEAEGKIFWATHREVRIEKPVKKHRGWFL